MRQQMLPHRHAQSAVALNRHAHVLASIGMALARGDRHPEANLEH